MVKALRTRLENGWLILKQALILMHEYKAFYWFAVMRMIGGGILQCIVLYALVIRFLGNFTCISSTETLTAQGCHVAHYRYTYTGSGNPELALLSLFGILFLGLLLPQLLESMITLYANATLHKQSITWKQLLMDTGKTIWHMACWVIFNLTVGILIRTIAGNRNERGFSIVSFIRNLIGWLLSVAWSVTTFLVPQVIALENKNVISGISTSFNLLKKTFGESIAANFVFGLFSSSCWACVFGILSASAYLHAAMTSLHFPVFTIMLCLPFIYLASLIGVAKIIFKTSIYCYAKNHETVGFEPMLIKNSFK